MNDIKKLLKTDKTGLVNSFCTVPWTNLLINETGLMFACGCEGKVKKPIGNILDINSEDEFLNIFNNNIMRDSILDKSYKLCNAYKCELLQDSILKSVKPNIFTTSEKHLSTLKLETLWLQIDESCNLQCPSCRDNVIIHKNNKKTEIIKLIIEKVEKYIIENCRNKLTIRLVGNGELFASNTLLPWFLNFNFEKNKNINFFIHTNATLLSRYENFLVKIADRLSGFEISIDASSPQIYKTVRKGGNWNELLLGLETFKKLKTINKNLGAVFSFVVSSNNYKDIPNFINFSKDYNVSVIFYKILQWSMTSEKFSDLNIFSPKHPEHQDFNSLLETIDFNKTNINTTMFNVKLN